VCSTVLEFLQKNMGDPYYEPTIVVHDSSIVGHVHFLPGPYENIECNLYAICDCMHAALLK